MENQADTISLTSDADTTVVLAQHGELDDGLSNFQVEDTNKNIILFGDDGSQISEADQSLEIKVREGEEADELKPTIYKLDTACEQRDLANSVNYVSTNKLSVVDPLDESTNNEQTEISNKSAHDVPTSAGIRFDSITSTAVIYEENIFQEDEQTVASIISSDDMFACSSGDKATDSFKETPDDKPAKSVVTALTCSDSNTEIFSSRDVDLAVEPNKVNFNVLLESSDQNISSKTHDREISTEQEVTVESEASDTNSVICRPKKNYNYSSFGSESTAEGYQNIDPIKETTEFLVDNVAPSTQPSHTTSKPCLTIPIEYSDNGSSIQPDTEVSSRLGEERRSINKDNEVSGDFRSEPDQVNTSSKPNDMRNSSHEGEGDIVQCGNGLEKVVVKPLPQTPFTPWFSPPPNFQSWQPFSGSKEVTEALKARFFSHFHTSSLASDELYIRRHHSDSCYSAHYGSYDQSRKNIRGLWSSASVKLGQSELSHILHVISKAELDDAFCSNDERLYKMLLDGKICFYCRTTRFTFFGRRGRRCALCRRLICEDCLTKIRMPHEYMDNVPVFALCPKDSIVYKITAAEMIRVRNTYRSCSLTCLATSPLPRSYDDCSTVVEYRGRGYKNDSCSSQSDSLTRELVEAHTLLEKNKQTQNQNQSVDQSDHNRSPRRHLFTQHCNPARQPAGENHLTSLHSKLQALARAKFPRFHKLRQQKDLDQYKDLSYERQVFEQLINPFIPSQHDLRTDVEGLRETSEGNSETGREGVEVCFGCETTILDVVRFNRWRPNLSLLMLSDRPL